MKTLCIAALTLALMVTAVMAQTPAVVDCSCTGNFLVVSQIPGKVADRFATSICPVYDARQGMWILGASTILPKGNYGVKQGIEGVRITGGKITVITLDGQAD